MSSADIENWLDVEQMSEILRITPGTFRNHKLPEIKTRCRHFKDGKRVLVPEPDFRRYLNSRIVEPSLKV